MAASRFEQTRINQLISTYGPDEPPRLPLNFGDYLSILWRIDTHADDAGRVKYYRRCSSALAEALGLSDRRMVRFVDSAEPGDVYNQLANVPYQATKRLLVDAHDRKAAIRQLLLLRADVIRVGTYQGTGGARTWPGSGIEDDNLRERVFAVLFTALQSQYANFGRLLFVTDIVLGDLLIGEEPSDEMSLQNLVELFRYPHPDDPKTRSMFYGEAI